MRDEGFVARACLGFVSSSQVEPVTRLNRPISGAGFAPASPTVLLAAPIGLENDRRADPLLPQRVRSTCGYVQTSFAEK